VESINNDAISFVNGDGDFVWANTAEGTINHPGLNITNDTITFGNGKSDSVVAYGDVSSGTITFGSGDRDYVFSNFGNVSNNTVTFGNGNGDYVEENVENGDGGKNKVTFGNGNNDQLLFSPGRADDSITTGTGAGDTVSVGTHSKADTFGFSIGTNGTNFTTVAGAMTGDHVVVNGGALGSGLASEPALPSGATLANFISALGTLTPGTTYVANNTTDTFIATDTNGGQLGAIELVGVFNVSIAKELLTLA
jgi:hypothetical protein